MTPQHTAVDASTHARRPAFFLGYGLLEWLANLVGHVLHGAIVGRIATAQ